MYEHIEAALMRAGAQIELLQREVALLRFRAKQAEDALRELVTLKDIKDECRRRRQRRPCSVTRVFPQDLLDAEADYKARKPRAWHTARVVLLGPTGGY